jgi:hypothetical protein
VVIHRVGIGRWHRPVAVTRGSARERQFAEREWSGLFNSLLLEVERRHPDVLWVNSPSASMIASNKYHLLATADLDGLRVPSLLISTENRLPASTSGEYVCKAINEDEDIDGRRTFSSARLPNELLAASPFHTDCPSLIQERVAPEYELRAYYLLGHVFGLKLLARGGDYVDIRLLPRETLEVEPVEVAPGLAQALRRYCHRHRLAYCVFDFLCARDGGEALIDVTPSGTWSHYESASCQLVTEWYADTVVRAVGT